MDSNTLAEGQPANELGPKTAESAKSGQKNILEFPASLWISAFTHIHIHTRQHVSSHQELRFQPDFCPTSSHPIRCKEPPSHHLLTLTLCSIKLAPSQNHKPHALAEAFLFQPAYIYDRRRDQAKRPSPAPHPAPWQDEAADSGKGSEDQHQPHMGKGEVETVTRAGR